jgi:glutaredoxin
MPLREVEFPSDPKDLEHAQEQFLIFYSSRVNGQLWCPDCVAVDRTIQDTFGPEDGPSAVIVYVGQKPEWKTPSNIFRGEPWQITSVPTVIKVEDSKVAGRLDSEINALLAAFIQG